MSITITDTALRQAARKLACQLAAALPEEDAVFSAGFGERMAPLLRRQKRRRTVRLVRQRTAACDISPHIDKLFLWFAIISSGDTRTAGLLRSIF